MQAIDWAVLAIILTSIVLYGVWKTKKVNSAKDFLSGQKQSDWWVIGLSIMATQASAITFLSTPGQAYFDGLGFVQFYFGLPIAMVILCMVVLPKYFALNVYTAYEFLESRFGVETRVLTAILFLIQRGLAAGITIFAPSIILSTILGWHLNTTNILIGSLVIIYTLIGGTSAVNQTQKQQMLVIFIGMITAFVTILQSLPVSATESIVLSGKLDKLNAVNFKFDLNNRYNIWSAFLGGTFLFLSYFGTDQSQVQRYLSGQSLKEAKMGLLFNALFKVPMQLFILLTGVLVFLFFQFNKSPIHFNPIVNTEFANNSTYNQYQQEFDELFEQRAEVLNQWKEAKHNNNTVVQKAAIQKLQENKNTEVTLRNSVKEFVQQSNKPVESNDKDYVFIYFILNYLPHGLIGLLIAVILSAAMSSTSSELNALATTTGVDIYKRLFNPNVSDKDFLLASRLFTLFWGLLAIFFAVQASLFENLIQAVNIIGSLFYGVILGVFAIAFLFPKISGKAVMFSIFIVEPIVILLYLLDQQERIELEFLWLNPIGCLLLIAVAFTIQNLFLQPRQEQIEN